MSVSKPLQSQTVKELRQIAANLKIVGRSKLTTKAKLIAAIERAQARPVSAKPSAPTVQQLRAEAKARGLRGFSKLNKSGLEKLLASTAKLAKPAPTDHELVISALAQLPVELNDAKCLARYLAGRATPTDTRVLIGRELRAVANLRDEAATDSEWRKWASKYMTLAGVMQ